MDHVLEVSTRLELAGHLAGGSLRLQEENDLRGHVGHHEGVGVLLAVEGSGSVAIEVERAEPYGADTEGKPEHGPHSRCRGQVRRTRASGGQSGRRGRVRARVARAGSASTHGPSPKSYCSCSMSALTSSVVHTEPRGTSPHISMIPAPVIPVTSAHTRQSRAVSAPGSSPSNRATIRCRRSPTTTYEPGGRSESE